MHSLQPQGNAAQDGSLLRMEPVDPPSDEELVACRTVHSSEDEPVDVLGVGGKGPASREAEEARPRLSVLGTAFSLDWEALTHAMLCACVKVSIGRAKRKGIVMRTGNGSASTSPA